MDAIGSTTKKLHPLVATAAVAVTVVCVLGAIVLITDQVAAHRGPDPASTAASGSAGAPAAAGVPSPYAPGTQAGSPPPPPAGVPPGAPPDVAMAPPPAPPACADCGIVAGVRVVKTPGQGSGVGAVAGGVVGGLVGNQFGRGGGRDAMTVLGAIGGAFGGNEVEKEVKSTTHYEVDVRLDNGRMRTITMAANPGPIVGTRVKIHNGQLIREAPQS
jgi:outer membrane lipoprotein SlyB